MASVSSGGLGDILSLALKKTGVPSAQSPSAHPFEPSSVLNEAAGAINDSLLSSDLNTLTQGLFSDLASVKGPSPSSQRSTNSETVFSESVVPSVQASPPRNGTVQVHTPTCSVAEPLSMPVLVRLPSSTHEQSYPQNSIQPTRPGPVSTPSASTPIISVSGNFSGVSGGAQPIASSSSSFASPQGETPPRMTNNSSQAIKAEAANVDQYDYTSVLHGDNLDLDSLDEFLATDPMDMPPPPAPPVPAPPVPVYQNHQFPPAYSSPQHHQHAPVAINNSNNGPTTLLYSHSQSGVPNHQSPPTLINGINSGAASPNSNNNIVSPYASNAVAQGHHQQQAISMTQYAGQQPMMAAPGPHCQSYQGQGAVISSPPQLQQQMVIVTCAPSINPHFHQSMSPTTGVVSNMSMATDLSNIMPSDSSILPSLSANGSSGIGTGFEMPSLSGEDISSILDLDMNGGGLDFDLNQFNFEGGSSVTSDTFASLGMPPSTDLIQPSDTVRLNGSSLINSPMGSAVNGPHVSYGSGVTAQHPPRPTTTTYGHSSTALQQQHQQQQQQQAAMRSRFNIMQGSFRRGSQTLTKMSIPRARNVGMGRDAIPMPAEPMVSNAGFVWLYTVYV